MGAYHLEMEIRMIMKEVVTLEKLVATHYREMASTISLSWCSSVKSLDIVLVSSFLY